MFPNFSGNGTLVSHNVTIAGHRTSFRLEPGMWTALKEIAARERLSIHELCTKIDERREGETTLSAAVRSFMLGYYRAAATEEGHQRARHGNGDPFAWAQYADDNREQTPVA